MSTSTEISAPAGREPTAEAPPPATRPKPGRRTDRVAYLFLLPWFAGLLLLTAAPLLGSLYLSFTRFNLLQSPAWNGFGNYVKMFTDDPRYLQSLKVTFIYVALTVPLELAIRTGRRRDAEPADARAWRLPLDLLRPLAARRQRRDRGDLGTGVRQRRRIQRLSSRSSASTAAAGSRHPTRPSRRWCC